MAEVSAKIVLEGVDKASPVIRKIHKQILAATKEIRAKNQAVAESFRSLGGSLKTVALAAAAAGGGLFALVKSTVNAGDNFLKMSQKVGVSIEGLQKLLYAGDLAGISQEEMGTALKFLNKNLVEARGGSKDLAKAFRVLKIDPKKMKDTENAFIEIGGAIGQLKDEQLQTALSMQIFGRSGSELLPLFKQGASGIRAAGIELEEMGAILGPDFAKRSEEFNDNLTRIGAQFGAFKTLVGSELLVVFEDVVGSTKEWLKTNRELIKIKVREFARDIRDGLIWIKENGPRIIERIKGITDALGGVMGIVKKLGIIWGIVLGIKAIKVLVDLASLAWGVSKAIWGIVGAGKGVLTALGGIPALVIGIAAVLGVLVGYTIARWGKVKKAFTESAIEIVTVWKDVFGSLFSYLIERFKETGRIAAGLMNPMSLRETLASIKSGEAFSGSKAALDRFQNATGRLRERGPAGAMPILDLWKSGLEKLGPGIMNDLKGIRGMFGGGGGQAQPSSQPKTTESFPQLIDTIRQGLQGDKELSSSIKALETSLKKPQSIDLRIKVDSPVPTQVASVSASPGLNISARTGQMIP